MSDEHAVKYLGSLSALVATPMSESPGWVLHSSSV